MDPRYKEWLEHPITEAVLRQLEHHFNNNRELAVEAFLADPLAPHPQGVRRVFFADAGDVIINGIKEGNIDLSTQ
jgi:hypothetical protein